jgi:hypothetical protein
MSIDYKAARLAELINAKRKRIAEGSIETFGGPSYKDVPGNMAYMEQKNQNDIDAVLAENKEKQIEEQS